ncbi:MAG: right-handed parallel beta-helix repeat-containing protein, partial [Kiritimatiellae bacterium]|nr:right-handed parallel beta-helix repeat-containing protein [Kiritimatiellia bacterium]
MSMRSDRPWNRSVLARLVLAGLSAATVCHAATLVVPDDHATIQAAVNAAAAGDTVYIRPGVYSEVITVSGSVTLAGSQPSTTVIDGGGTGTVVHATGATNVVIRGLTIRNGHHGIHLDETHYSSITNCAIAENGLSGVYIYPKSSHNHITDCDIFSNCLSNSDWSGLNLGDWHDQQYNVFSSCNIYSNAGDGVAGWITTDHTQVHDCTIYGNRRGIVVGWSQWSISGCSIYSNVEHGILLDSVKSTLITNCWLACSSCGMELAGTGGTYDNVIADNRVESNGQGFNVTSLVRRTLVVGNRIAGNAKGIYIVCNESRPCYDNTFYGNDFIGNTVHAQVDEDRYSNTWDNGYPAGGNYWEDYAGVDDYGGPNQDQAGSDGIGDTAYTVSAGNVDRYPRYAFSETFSLTVTSVFGNPTPATGIHQLPRLSSVAGSVEVPASGSHTQHVCTGWTGSGSVPPSGSDTNLQFVIAQPSTLTWQWRTDYRFEGAADSGGDVSLTSGWYADGTVLTVEAVPAGGYAFVGWAGDVPAGSAGMNPLSLTMDRARSIRAQFAAVREWVVPTEFPTIQAALNAAHAYDVVHVSAGTYPEVLTLGRPVTLEGEGAAVTTIDGGGTGTVIRVAGTTNVVIRGLTVRNGHHGIHLDDTHWSRIANCVVAEHQKCGVYLYPKSSHNEVTDCEIFHTCQADSGWSGLNLGDFQGQQHNVFSSCNIYSNLGAGIVGYVTTDDTRVHDCNIWENLHGIIVGWSQWSISGCTIQSNGSHGIILDTARNGLITNCLVSANAYGVEFAGWGPYYNLVVDNSIDANGHGLAMTCQARYNMVLHNRLSRNDEGLFVVRNQDHPCYDNTFYGNDFAGNTVQARIEEDRYSNTWDNGYPAGGNYWDDYAGADVQSGPNQDQAGSDGIGDTAYVVTNANVDRYPKYELPAVVGLTVESVYGNPSPAVGEHLVPRWSSVACSVEAVVSGNFTQRVCTGWTGTGSVPADGVTSNVEVMMTQPSTLTWLWRTDYRFEGQADPGGALSATSDWYEAGTVLTVAASVSNGYRFVGWAGDVPPGQEGANPLDLTMDRARSIRALFSAMTEWVVPTDSPTIQAALDAAGAYDVVRVLAGTYPETLTIGRAVTLEGAGAGLTVIDGGGTGTVIHATGATNVVIRGLTVRNGHHGVQLDSTHYSSLTNCAIAENGNCGVYMRLGSSHNEITDCDVFRNCLTDSGWSGLNLSDTHNQQHNRFSCCNVYSNEGAGIVGYSTTDNTQVENCTVYRNPSGIIVGHSQWTISGCSVYSNVHNGIVLDSAKSTLMTNCWVAYSSCGMELAGTGGTYD